MGSGMWLVYLSLARSTFLEFGIWRYVQIFSCTCNSQEAAFVFSPGNEAELYDAEEACVGGEGIRKRYTCVVAVSLHVGHQG